MVDTLFPTRLNVLLPYEQEGWHQTMRQLLEPHGVQTVAARNGREAWRIVESGAVHVAVLDAEMPQLNGMQIVRRMNDLATPPPAILLTNHMTSHLLQEAYYPSLRNSWPALDLFQYDGQIADGQLTSPTAIRFSHKAGGTI